MIGSLISPAISLNLIRIEISKQLKKKVNRYKIFYKEDSKPFSLFFIVDSEKHPFDDEGKISTIIKEQLKEKVPGKNIDGFLIIYDKPDNEKPDIKAQIFYSYDKDGKTINERIETKF